MIRANFNAYNSYVTDSLYQWDKNQDLAISGLNLSVAPEIRFTNVNMDKSIVRQSTLTDGVVTVRIPNSLLQQAYTIRAYVGIYDNDTYKTIEVIDIPIIATEKPADYTIEDSDEEIYSFNKLENEIANVKKEISDTWDSNLEELTNIVEQSKTDLENEVASNTNILNARIDNIIGHNNDTEGNTELLDIRVGAYGELYSTAGNAVRGQFGHVDSVFEKLPNETKAITPIITKKEMWNVTGNTVERLVTASTAYCLCEPIEVEESTLCEVTVQSYTSAKNSVIVVDENYIVLYSYNTNLTEIMTTRFRTPIGAKYLLINTSNPTSVVPKPTVSITSYKETATNKIVNEIKNNSEYCFNNSIQNVTVINGAIKERSKLWSIENEKAVLVDTTSTGHIADNEIPIKFGQIIKVTTNATSKDGYPCFIVVDNEYNVLYTGLETDLNLIVPPNSAFVLVNSFSTVNYTNVTIKDTDIWSGKTVAVIGDSISTKVNLNAVEMTITEEDIGVELSAYLTYYDVNTNTLSLGGHTFTSDEIGTEVTFTPTAGDVGKVIGSVKNHNTVATTWWEFAQEELGFSTIPVCWSGASITSHEANANEYKCAHAWHESQIRKCGIRTPGTMERTAPDIIIIFRGCNDMTHEPYTRLTSDYFDNVNLEYPTTDELSDGTYGFKEGYVLLISKLRETYPNAKIFVCTLSMFKRVNCSHFPTNNGLNTLPQYNNAIREIADYMGCGLIEFDKCGITFENCYSEGYITDSSTTPTHPATKGHLLMSNKAIRDLKEQFITI